jgi:hypothetical protein
VTSYPAAIENPENKEKIKSLLSKVESMGQTADSQQDEFRTLAAHLTTLEQPIKQLHARFVENKVLVSEWDEATTVRPFQAFSHLFIFCRTSNSNLTYIRDLYNVLILSFETYLGFSRM